MEGRDDRTEPEAPRQVRSLSYSRRSSFQRCQRRYYWEYVQKLSPIETPAPLRMGAIYSDAIEHGDWDIVKQKYDEIIDKELMGSNSRFIEQLITEEVMVEALAQTYLENVCLPNVTREVPFKRMNSGYADNGRLDGLISHGYGKYTIVENKLKGRFLRSDEEALAIDDQITAYVYNLVDQYGVNVSDVSVRYEVALKPGLRQTQKETVQDFRRRLRDTILTDPHRFHKVFSTSRTMDDLIEYELRFNAIARQVDAEMENQESGRNAWPMNTQACGDYGGCPFMKLCTKQINTKDELLKNYKTREYNK